MVTDVVVVSGTVVISAGVVVVVTVVVTAGVVVTTLMLVSMLSIFFWVRSLYLNFICDEPFLHDIFHSLYTVKSTGVFSSYPSPLM